MNDFIPNLRERTEQAALELSNLEQESRRIKVRIENTKSYIDELNRFVDREEQKTILER